MARIVITLPIPKKWWHILLLPLTIPLYAVFVAVLVPLFWLLAWMTGKA